MTAPKPVLPDAWVDKIFSRLTAAYGHQFTDNYTDMVNVNGKMVEVGMQATKKLWAQELGGFYGKGAALKYALDHLPMTPPNIFQFREMARSAIDIDGNGIPLPQKFTPEELARNKIEARKLLESLRAKKTMSTKGKLT